MGSFPAGFPPAGKRKREDAITIDHQTDGFFLIKEEGGSVYVVNNSLAPSFPCP